MGKVIKQNKMIAGGIGILLYIVIFMFFIESSTDVFFKNILQLVFICSLPIILVVFTRVLKSASIKRLQGKEYERIDLINKKVKPLIVVMITFVVFVSAIIMMLDGDQYIIFMLMGMSLYRSTFMNVVYVSEDSFIYNNNILKLDEITKCEKEKQFLWHHIRCWSNGESYVLKVGNISIRDKIYEILENKIVE